MAATTYAVTAPLLIIKDQAGRNHHTYFGSIVHYLNAEQKAHFLRLGLVKEIHTIIEADEFSQLEAPVAAILEKPKKVSPKADWVNFGVAKGNDRAELESLTKEELVDLLDEF
jgi:hypothetical protein